MVHARAAALGVELRPPARGVRDKDRGVEEVDIALRGKPRGETETKRARGLVKRKKGGNRAQRWTLRHNLPTSSAAAAWDGVRRVEEEWEGGRRDGGLGGT